MPGQARVLCMGGNTRTLSRGDLPCVGCLSVRERSLPIGAFPGRLWFAPVSFTVHRKPGQPPQVPRPVQSGIRGRDTSPGGGSHGRTHQHTSEHTVTIPISPGQCPGPRMTGDPQHTHTSCPRIIPPAPPTGEAVPAAVAAAPPRVPRAGEGDPAPTAPRSALLANPSRRRVFWPQSSGFSASAPKSSPPASPSAPLAPTAPRVHPAAKPASPSASR